MNTLALSAALAFTKARSKMPDPKLYPPDQRHLSVAKTYPSALPIYAAKYKKSPVGSMVPKGIEAESGKMLKEVRWGTAQECLRV